LVGTGCAISALSISGDNIDTIIFSKTFKQGT
jgi:hypothetical protein